MSSETNELCLLPNRGLLFMKQFAPRGRKLQFIMVWKTQFPHFVEFVQFSLRTCVYVMGNAPKVHLESSCSSYYSI